MVIGVRGPHSERLQHRIFLLSHHRRPYCWYVWRQARGASGAPSRVHRHNVSSCSRQVQRRSRRGAKNCGWSLPGE